ncbi:hypothetical protein [Paenimyroides baculatum]|uniref:Uncharacterized protein n=1 Tax=Paenimyroides baculatum TaxID=2608000 RepID=A0A5M6CE14_9FLAO|nr:hypothetical protein [Paenimyroides baculatum]KAA5531695.1 hypothetical protein F0460_15525 [Paenimyroides baculatum]
MSTASVQTTSNSPALVRQFLDLSDCVTVTVEPGKPCKGSGNPKHNYGESCGMSGSDRATQGSVVYDFSGCDNSSGGGSGGGNPGSGGGSVGSPGGGGNSGGGGSTPNPIKSNPTKKFKDFLDKIRIQINIQNTDRNSKILNSLVENNKVTLKELYDKRNEQREYGYRFSKTKTGDLIKVTAPGALPLVTNTQLGTKVLRTNHSIIGFTHTHGNTTIQSDGSVVHPMFSHTDIMALFDMVNKNPSIDKSPPDLFVSLIVNDGFYVIMLPNDVTHDNIATKYSNFATMNGNNMTANDQAQVWKDIRKDLKGYYDNIARQGSNKSIKYEKALLLKLKEYNLNVKVYKMPDDGGLFNGKWRALSLPANSKDPFDNTQPIETILN